MLSHPRTLALAGLVFVLALLFSVSPLVAHRASAHTAQADRPLPASAVHFVQTATSANTVGDSTFIDNIATNNQPNVALFVTLNYNPGGKYAHRDPRPVGVWYTGKRWAIFNEDQANMPLNTAFNVLVVPIGAGGGLVFSQTAAPNNISYNATDINNVFTNGNPDAQLLITQSWNPIKVYNPHNVGVRYDASTNKWGILNEDGASMPSGASFNVMVGASASGGGTEFLQTATASNTYGEATFINNGLINWDPNAIVFVTHRYNGIYNNDPAGIWYESGRLPAEWAVYNEYTLMPIGASFTIVAFSS